MVALGFATSISLFWNLELIFPGVHWQEEMELKENIVNCSIDRTRS